MSEINQGMNITPEKQAERDELYVSCMSPLHPARAVIHARDATIKRLEAEVAEQCRLNGMGSEREAKLMAEVDELRIRVVAREPERAQTTKWIYPASFAEARDIVEKAEAKAAEWKEKYERMVLSQDKHY